MKMTVTEYSFLDTVRAHDRLGQFGQEGWLALFDYLEQLEDDTGEEIELDVVAFCCDFMRFDSVEEYNRVYGTEYEDAEDIDELACMIDDDAFICYAH